ncbi:hypothetical protein TNIN_407721 [Trichonephila inaurata madagascariensis]|uniref:Uncharacterized protein n=1 Tax=Trichonephila inaurata madagascariensis TaxID=2747483 RepID=A0A8X6IEV1_9ARAC|nr:hypothetical protein TNIN_407721 [Trichonephila inaurata madagascariensis]
MAKEILMGAFVLLHCLFCLLKVFCHFDLLYCLHLIPYFIFIDLVKNNLLSNNILERCLSNTTCSSSTLIGNVSDANETECLFIQESVDFFKEASNNDDEGTLVMDNANLPSNDLELAKNENHFLDDSAFINAVAINLIDAAVQCTQAERNGSMSSSTSSSSFTNVTEMDSFNNSEDEKDFGDFSLNSFKSDGQMESTSSDLTSLSHSEGDVQSTEGSYVLKKRNAFQKIKKLFVRLRKATPSCRQLQKISLKFIKLYFKKTPLIA